MYDAWNEKPLGELVVITIGRTPPRAEPRYWTTDLTRPFCTIADMTRGAIAPSREGVTEAAEVEGKAKRIPAGSLLMSFKLTIGKVGFASQDMFPNEAIAWLEPCTQEITSAYLALNLESQDLRAGSGRAVKGNTLNGPSLRAISVRYPSLPEQRRIVDLMNSFDRHIAAMDAERRALRVALGAIRQSLVDAVSWTPLVTLAAQGGVQIGPFGAQLHAHDYEEQGVPVVMPQDIIDGEIHTEKIKRVSEQMAQSLSRHRLLPGDLVLPRRGDLTKRAVVLPEQEGWLCGTGSIRIRLADPGLAPALMEGLSTSATDEWLNTNAVGSTMLNLKGVSI